MNGWIGHLYNGRHYVYLVDGSGLCTLLVGVLSPDPLEDPVTWVFFWLYETPRPLLRNSSKFFYNVHTLFLPSKLTVLFLFFSRICNILYVIFLFTRTSYQSTNETCDSTNNCFESWVSFSTFCTLFYYFFVTGIQILNLYVDFLVQSLLLLLHFITFFIFCIDLRFFIVFTKLVLRKLWHNPPTYLILFWNNPGGSRSTTKVQSFFKTFRKS